MPFALDEGLRDYATEKQWEKLQAIQEHGSQAAAAEAAGIDASNFSRTLSAVMAKAALHGYAPDHDMRHPVAPGFKAKGTSTLYDMQTGEARLQWQKTDRDAEQQAALSQAAFDGLKEELPIVEPVEAPPLDQQISPISTS